MAEEEQEMISHFSHHHPFTPIPAVESRTRWMASRCAGCWRYFVPGEAAYGCSNKCGHNECFHKECLEMPIKIRHPLHPSHPLKQVRYEDLDNAVNWVCAVCEDPTYWRMWRYICSEGCDQFFIHLTCAAQGAGAGAGAADNKITMKHPSHPPHGLKYLRRSCSFLCDACGTTEEGRSYACTNNICQYWIHESCARLPETQSFPRHHSHHTLSLAFSLPFEYIRYEYTCDVCKGGLRFKQWVYHCKLCSYVAHIKCATNTT